MSFATPHELPALLINIFILMEAMHIVGKTVSAWRPSLLASFLGSIESVAKSHRTTMKHCTANAFIPCVWYTTSLQGYRTKPCRTSLHCHSITEWTFYYYMIIAGPLARCYFWLECVEQKDRGVWNECRYIYICGTPTAFDRSYVVWLWWMRCVHMCMCYSEKIEWP